MTLHHTLGWIWHSWEDGYDIPEKSVNIQNEILHEMEQTCIWTSLLQRRKWEMNEEVQVFQGEGNSGWIPGLQALHQHRHQGVKTGQTFRVWQIHASFLEPLRKLCERKFIQECLVPSCLQERNTSKIWKTEHVKQTRVTGKMPGNDSIDSVENVFEWKDVACS